MNNIALFLVAGIVIAGFIGGIIGFVILAPKPWESKDQWLKKSVISSYTGMFGFFIAILALNTNYLLIELRGLDFGGIWKFIWSVLVYIVPGGILLAIGTYFKTLMGRARGEFVQKWVQNQKARRK